MYPKSQKQEQADLLVVGGGPGAEILAATPAPGCGNKNRAAPDSRAHAGCGHAGTS